MINRKMYLSVLTAFAVGFILTFAFPPPQKANAQVFGPTTRTPSLIVSPGNLTVAGTITSGGNLVCLSTGTNCPSTADPTKVPLPITCTAACDVSALVVGQSAFVVKTADETVNNNNTPQFDDVLQLNSAPAGLYLIEGYIGVTGSAGGGFRYHWNQGNSNVGNATNAQYFCASAAGHDMQNMDSSGFVNGRIKCTGVPEDFMIHGALMRSTSGNFRFTWSQDTATVGDTVVKANSWLKLTRIQ